jgi:hypothetical protein
LATVLSLGNVAVDRETIAALDEEFAGVTVRPRSNDGSNAGLQVPLELVNHSLRQPRRTADRVPPVEG